MFDLTPSLPVQSEAGEGAAALISQLEQEKVRVESCSNIHTLTLSCVHVCVCSVHFRASWRPLIWVARRRADNTRQSWTLPTQELLRYSNHTIPRFWCFPGQSYQLLHWKDTTWLCNLAYMYDTTALPLAFQMLWLFALKCVQVE